MKAGKPRTCWTEWLENQRRKTVVQDGSGPPELQSPPPFFGGWAAKRTAAQLVYMPVKHPRNGITSKQRRIRDLRCGKPVIIARNFIIPARHLMMACHIHIEIHPC